MTALRLEPDEERKLPMNTPTKRVRVPCGCQSGGRSIRFQVLAEAADWIRRACAPPPEMVIGSWFCPDCKWLVKVKAKHLHFSTAA